MRLTRFLLTNLLLPIAAGVIMVNWTTLSICSWVNIPCSYNVLLIFLAASLFTVIALDGLIWVYSRIKKPSLKTETFVEDNKVILCITNPNSKPATDLSVEIQNIEQKLFESQKSNVTNGFNRINRYFKSGDVLDMSAPIIPKGKRFVFIGRLDKTEFVFLTEKNVTTKEVWEWDLESSTSSVTFWNFRADIKLAIKAQVGTTNIDQSFKMWIEVQEKQFWDDGSGELAKLGALPIRETRLSAGEFRNESKKQNHKVKSAPEK